MTEIIVPEGKMLEIIVSKGVLRDMTNQEILPCKHLVFHYTDTNEQKNEVIISPPSSAFLREELHGLKAALEACESLHHQLDSLVDQYLNKTNRDKKLFGEAKKEDIAELARLNGEKSRNLRTMNDLKRKISNINERLAE